MTLSLTITDAQDGTGTATVAGSNIASTNTLYQTAWTGQVGSQTWTSAGSRTGDGTISLTGAGWWLWRLDSLLSGATSVVTNYQPLLNTSTQAMLYRACEAIRLRVVGLNLSGVTTNVIKKWLPRQLPTVDTLPAVLICPVGAEDFPGVMTNTDDIGLPILVAILDKQNQDLTANQNRNLLWRQQILSALRFQRLAGVAEAYTVKPVPSNVVDLSMFLDQNLFFSPLLFKVVTRTTRG
jgi:hypothetical protein